MPVKKRNVYGAIFFLYRLGVEKKMLQEGLEPPTLGLVDSCSTKLSYQSSCPRSGSNQGPSDLQSDALPTELSRLFSTCLAVWPNPLFYHYGSVHFIQIEDMKKHLKLLLLDLLHWKYSTD